MRLPHFYPRRRQVSVDPCGSQHQKSGHLCTLSVGPDPPYELLLFIDDGWLSSVELVWYGESPPSTFPALSDFEPAEHYE
jgi:hypothetical protein